MEKATEYKPEYVVNLADKLVCDIRLKIHISIFSNIVGFLNILEGCRHMVLSISSTQAHPAFMERTLMPFSVHDNVDHPLSLYAQVKIERMAHTYSHLYGLPTTGLRFFTVYGPWGRLIWLCVNL